MQLVAEDNGLSTGQLEVLECFCEDLPTLLELCTCAVDLNELGAGCVRDEPSYRRFAWVKSGRFQSSLHIDAYLSLAAPIAPWRGVCLDLPCLATRHQAQLAPVRTHHPVTSVACAQPTAWHLPQPSACAPAWEQMATVAHHMSVHPPYRQTIASCLPAVSWVFLLYAAELIAELAVRTSDFHFSVSTPEVCARPV